MASGPIWARPEPGERRASLTRERIARAAIELIDGQGVSALSMRRIAEALGVGTMTLYHYVRTKDDLLALIDDAVMGELLVEEAELPEEDWRAALRAIALQSRATLRRHPWLVTALGVFGNRIGPNGMRHFEQSLAAVAGTGLPPEERLEIVSLVDEYVFGYSLRAAGGLQVEEGALEEMHAFVEAQLATGEFPHLEALVPPGMDFAEAWARFEAAERDEERFVRGLDRLLEGIERDLERR
jgi:AcrR family transcriptional regulator